MVKRGVCVCAQEREEESVCQERIKGSHEEHSRGLQQKMANVTGGGCTGEM